MMTLKKTPLENPLLNNNEDFPQLYQNKARPSPTLKNTQVSLITQPSQAEKDMMGLLTAMKEQTPLIMKFIMKVEKFQ